MKTSKSKRKWIWILPGLLGLCLLTALVSAAINTALLRQAPNQQYLQPVEKARLAEAQHLREKIGDLVFPGWGSAPIAQVVYNADYVFLIGLPDPSKGWVKVPQEIRRGGAWQSVEEGDLYQGETYFRQRYVQGESPEAFTVRIGEQYAGSLPTFDGLQWDLINQFRTDLPPIINTIFPYKLMVNIFLPHSDNYLSLVQHENFHAFQATWAEERLFRAEKANLLLQEDYPWLVEANVNSWKRELETLQAALKAEDDFTAERLTDEFLTIRDQRRRENDLSSLLVQFEKEREWTEGMARYIELESWRLAAAAGNSDYQPFSELKDDSDFKNYQQFESRWKRELDQMVRMADDEGDGRFYYSGMAQAFLLDRFLPEWKAQFYADPNLNLEDLIRQLVAHRS